MIAMFHQQIARLAIFSGLDTNQIRHIAPFLVERSYAKDQLIFQQGQPAEHLYILLSGAVMVRYKPYDGPPLTVANIQSGGVFGWSSALRREIYTSSAVAVEDSLALCMRGASLASICNQFPDTGKILLDRLAGVIAERLRSTHTQVLGILCQGQEGQSMQRERKSAL